MNQIEVDEKIKYPFMDYVIVFLMIFFSSGYSLSIYSGTTRMLLFLVLAVVMIFSSAISTGSSMSRLSISPYWFILFLLFIISYAINGDSLDTMIIAVAYLFVLIVFCNRVSIDDWMQVYVRVIFFLACASLLLYAMEIVTPSLFNRLPVIQNKVGHDSRTIFFATYSGGYRNRGIVWEPGAYQTYLVIALAIEFFVNRINNKKRMFVILLALFTTFSTGGFVSLAVLVLSVLVDGLINGKQEKKKTRLFLSITIVLVVVSYYYIELFATSVYQKLFGKVFDFLDSGNLNTSVGTRYSAIIGGLKAFLDSPILGMGASKYRQFILGLYGNIMPTCTIVNYFGMFGLFAGLLVIGGTYKFTKFFTNNSLVRFMILLVIFFATLSEDFTLNPSLMLLFMYGFLGNNQQFLGITDDMRR